MLRLELSDYVGPASWRWRLSDDDGTPLAEYAVELDEQAWQFAAFADLHGYLRANLDAERGLAHEAELVSQLGDWLAEHALGPIAAHLAQARVPVLLTVPPEAADLAYRPWELATAEDRPLVAHRVSFVVDAPNPAGDKHDVGATLRMLAVFGVPSDDSGLNLRKQRFALARSIHQVSAIHDRAIELRVLQYGTTRQQLADVLREEDGWDVVHLSDRGLSAGLTLSDDAGHPDVVPAADLVDLLALGTERIKLVTLSTAESADVTATVQLQHLGMMSSGPVDAAAGRESLPELGSRLVQRLGCVVLAMRYPVVDDFAAALAEAFYHQALGGGQPIAEAAAMSVVQVAGALPTNSIPPRSLAAPTVIGSRAGLRLMLPPGDPTVFTVERQRLAEFPPQAPRFVGRVRESARAAEVFAEGSGWPGIALHGTAGIGKTAFALELAYAHQTSFTALAWYSAPPKGHPATTALSDFAIALERQLPGLRLAERTTDPAAWREVMPALTGLLDQARVLVVLDDIESLLTEDGEWADERWAVLVAALTGHRGRSRVVITSRVLPAGLPGTMSVERLGPLSVHEAVLLARELPRLRACIDGTVPDLTVDQAHDLAARTITLAQGHPTLMELAEGLVGYPQDLIATLIATDKTWRDRGTRLVSFLSGEAPDATDDGYLVVLTEWIRAGIAALPEETKVLFAFLCCLEPDDRFDSLINALWPEVWRRWGLPGETPSPDATAAPAVQQGLIAVDTAADTGLPMRYRLHSSAVEIGTNSESPFAEATDTTVGDAWLATLQDAIRRGTPDGRGGAVLRAVRSAAPYLIRGQRWSELLIAVHEALVHDESTASAVALLPIITTIAEATLETERELPAGRVHAQAIAAVDLERGQAELRELLAGAVAREDFAQASVLAGDLIRVNLATGALDEALAVAETKRGHTAQAGLGPWTRLADEGQLLQIMRMHGRHDEVLAGVTRLRETMAGLPEQSTEREAVVPSTIREMTLNLGVLAANDLELWEQALELNAALRQSLTDRGADEVEQALAVFNDSGPLVRLGRGLEARELLARCQQVFEAAKRPPLVGKALSARAEVEGEMGHLDKTLAFETEALRIKYSLGDADAIAVSHYNLAHYLLYIEAEPARIWAHCLAAAVIRYQLDSPNLTEAVQAVARMLPPGQLRFEGAPSFDQFCAIVDSQEGMMLAKLVPLLPHRAADGQAAASAVLELAVQSRIKVTEDAVAAWEPIVSAVVAARDSADDDEPAQVLDEALTALGGDPAWNEIATVIRRIHNGLYERRLTNDLNQADSAIARHTLDALDGTVEVDPNAWRTLIDT